MTRVARSLAATLALVLALLPVAMERCRTSCATAPAQEGQSPSSAHACHEVAGGGGDALLVPVARTCGHSLDARIDTLLGVTASKTRVVAHMAQAILPAHASAVVDQGVGRFPPGAASCAPRTSVPLNLPLRL